MSGYFTEGIEGDGLRDKAVKIAAHFLERRGFEVLELGYGGSDSAAPIVAEDEDDLVFVRVTVSRDGFPPIDGPFDRAEMEAVAGSYLAAAELRNISVRFDDVSVWAIGVDRALMRHTTNIMGKTWK